VRDVRLERCVCFTVSETTHHRRLGEVTVLQRTPNLAQVVAADGEPLWVKVTDLGARPAKVDERILLERQRVAARAAIAAHDTFTAYLREHFDEVFIYFTYPEHSLTLVEEILADIGQAGVDHRPLRLGSRGGPTGRRGQRSVRFAVCFKPPDDPGVLPRGVHFFRGHKSVMRLFNTAYAIELAKMFGFRVTNHEFHHGRGGHGW